ncbi:ABC transporter permease subunit [Actinophytocola sp.]|uniref:ABC transporter permease subunit n=1 Tax=Actinophytocola sp. TaxID=1872138 RepID=UPI0025BCE241|nr:ABC transporter permease subunit [Actinophytocola sp.]
MGRLIKAEFRKILTTKLWWAMMIPAFILALAWAWGVSALTTDIVDDVADEAILTQFNISIDQLSWSAIALTRSMNIATIFPMIFGALALASEINRKTITTSFLTAPNRGSLLSAKAVTYVVWGLIFGVLIAVGASLGTVIGSGSDYLPSGGDWLMIALSGILGCLLWTLLGLGVGALLGSPVGALVLLLIYSLIVGPIGDLVMTGLTDGSYLAGFLPNGAANGLTGSTASQVLFTQVQDLILNVGGGLVSQDDQEGFEEVVRAIAGAPGALTLWISGLIFLAWTAIFFALGILRNRTRDIT